MENRITQVFHQIGKRIQVGVMSHLQLLAGPTLAATIMGVVVFSLGYLMHRIASVELLVQVIVGVVVYWALAHAMRFPGYIEILNRAPLPKRLKRYVPKPIHAMSAEVSR